MSKRCIALLIAALSLCAHADREQRSGGVVGAIKDFHDAYSVVNSSQLDDALLNDSMLPQTSDDTPMLWQNYLDSTPQASDIEGIYTAYRALMTLSMGPDLSVDGLAKAFANPENLSVNDITIPESSPVLAWAQDAKRVRFIQATLTQCIKIRSQSKHQGTASSLSGTTTASDPLLTWAPACNKSIASSLITQGNVYLNRYKQFGFVTSVPAGNSTSSSDFVFAQTKTAQSALESLQKVLEKAVFSGLYDLTFAPANRRTVDPTPDHLIQANTITRSDSSCSGENVLSAEHAKGILQGIDRAYPLNFTLPSTLIPANQPSLALVPETSNMAITRRLGPATIGKNGSRLGALATTIAQRRLGYLSDIQDAETSFIQSVGRLHKSKQSVINDMKFLLEERTPVSSSKPCQSPMTIMKHNSTWRTNDTTWQKQVGEFTSAQSLQELVRMQSTQLSNQYKLYLMQARILAALSELRLMQLNEQRVLAQNNRSTLVDLVTASDQGASNTSVSSSTSMINSLMGS